MLLIAGTACQRRPSSANHGCRGWISGTSRTRPGAARGHRPVSGGPRSPAAGRRTRCRGRTSRGARTVSVSSMLRGSPTHPPSVDAVAGVADELFVADARAGPAGAVRGEDRDGGPDPAAVRGLAQMADALGGDAHRPVASGGGRAASGTASTGGRCSGRSCARRRGRRIRVRRRCGRRCRRRGSRRPRRGGGRGARRCGRARCSTGAGTVGFLGEVVGAVVSWIESSGAGRAVALIAPEELVKPGEFDAG